MSKAVAYLESMERRMQVRREQGEQDIRQLINDCDALTERARLGEPAPTKEEDEQWAAELEG